MQARQQASELISLEKEYWKAMQDHDLDTAASLTDFPCLVAGPDGARLVDEPEYREMFDLHKDYSMKVSFVDEPTVRMLDEHTAAIAYSIHCEITGGGKTEKLDAVDTSTWTKRGDKWTCFHHTETPLKKDSREDSKLHPNQVEIRRTFPLGKQKLREYFTTASLAEQWAYPDGMTLEIPSLDFKVGGKYRWEHTLNGGKYVAEGHFQEISPDRIVQIDEVITDPEGKILMTNTKCTISFQEVNGGSEAKVVQSGFQTENDAQECQKGWEQSFNHLESLIGRGKERLARPA